MINVKEIKREMRCSLQINHVHTGYHITADGAITANKADEQSIVDDYFGSPKGTRVGFQKLTEKNRLQAEEITKLKEKLSNANKNK